MTKFHSRADQYIICNGNKFCFDCVTEERDRYKAALQHIIGFYGPGLDGSPEECAGFIARKALEGNSISTTFGRKL